MYINIFKLVYKGFVIRQLRNICYEGITLQCILDFLEKFKSNNFFKECILFSLRFLKFKKKRCFLIDISTYIICVRKQIPISTSNIENSDCSRILENCIKLRCILKYLLL